MAFVVTIDGTDRTDQVDWKSLNINQAITSQVDTCNFFLKTYGTKTYVPSLNDEVIVENDGVKLFAGIVVSTQQTAKNYDALVTTVVCKDYAQILDRYLVVDSFENKTVGWIINTIMNLYVNVVQSIINTFESSETWTAEAGTITDDTTYFRAGDGSKKLSTSGGVAASANIGITEDLTTFETGQASTTADMITWWVRIDDPSLVSNIRLRLTSDAPGTYTNYYEYDITSGFQTGFNFFFVPKSAFTTVGAPSWAALTATQIYVNPSSATDIDTYWDDLRMVESDAFTQSNVNGAFTIDYAAFNYEQVSQVLAQLADQANFDWYVDYDKDIHFFSQEANTAPFNLSDTSGNFLWNTFQYKEDISQLRNQIIVRGGEFLGSTLTEELGPQADGAQTIFQLGYRYDNYSMTKNAVGQTIGIKNVDDPTLFNAMYDQEEKVVEFAVAPLLGDTITWTGDPFYPVVVKLRDSVSIAEFGVYESKIIDKTINTREGARQRARAELEKYKEELEEGSFATLNDGLRAGQYIEVDLTSRGIDQSFLITRLGITMNDPSEPKYTATLVTKKLFGMIEFLINLLRNQDKQIVINPDEVLDLVEAIDEIITLDDPFTININLEEITEDMDTLDAHVERALNDDDIWVAGGVYHPTDLITDRNRPPRANVGAEAT